MKNALLIVNPNAGQMKSKSNLFTIISTLSNGGILPTVYVTKSKGDAKRFIIENADKYEAVVCCGGDGTLNETVNGLVAANACHIPLGYIPAGSTNDFAASLGISPNPEIAAKSIVYGVKRPLDLGFFNKSRCFTYVASFGAFTKASYNTPQNIKNTIGHAAYIIEGAKMIPEIKPFKLSCTCDGKVIEGNFLFGAVANSISIAGFKLLSQQGVKYDDGKFELILVRNPENLTETFETVDDFILRNYGTKNIIIERGSNFTLNFEKPIDFSLDGEYGDAHTSVEISVTNKMIQLLNR